MGFTEDLENQTKDYLEGDYEVTETRTIPEPNDVAFGKKAKKMNLCALSIDMRKSSHLLMTKHKQTAGKIHKAFLNIASRVVNYYSGEIRSFQGDALLAFWPAYTKDEIDKAVRAAMSIKWFLDIKLTSYFEKYEKIDFGIGIDWGVVFIIRTGISRNTNNNDLVYIGKCVNFATAIANQAYGPNHIEISDITYSNLLDSGKYGKNSDGENVDMWTNCKVPWVDQEFTTKCTTWYMEI